MFKDRIWQPERERGSWHLNGVIAAALLRLSAPQFTPRLQEGDILPRVMLRDHYNQLVAIGAGDEPVTVLTFFSIRCADPRICSTVSGKFAWMQAHLHAGAALRLIEVTLDPEHDRVPQLAQYAHTVGADGRSWKMATTNEQELSQLLERLGIRRIRQANTSVVHSEAVVILDREGRIAHSIAGSTFDPVTIIGQARAVAGLEQSPFLALSAWLAQRASALCGVGGSSAGMTVGAALAVLLASGLAFVTWLTRWIF